LLADYIRRRVPFIESLEIGISPGRFALAESARVGAGSFAIQTAEGDWPRL